MARHILQPRDGVMFSAVAADITQKSTDQGNFGFPLEFSQYNCIAYQAWWNGLDGSGVFKLQVSLKSSPTDSDWVDKIGGEIETSGASGTDINVISNIGEKSIRILWVPDANTTGTVSAEAMAKDSSGPASFTRQDPLEVTSSFTGLRNGGKIQLVEVPSNSWIALPPIPLAGRNSLSIQNISGIEIKINYDPTDINYFGVTIADGMERFYDASDTITIYAKAKIGLATIMIEELS